MKKILCFLISLMTLGLCLSACNTGNDATGQDSNVSSDSSNEETSVNSSENIEEMEFFGEPTTGLYEGFDFESEGCLPAATGYLGYHFEKTEYPIDDVEVTLYYGNLSMSSYYEYPLDGIEGVKFSCSIVINNEKFIDQYGSQMNDDKDYKDIMDTFSVGMNGSHTYIVDRLVEQYYMKEYSCEKEGGKVVYAHKENVTIPKELFVSETGTICIEMYYTVRQGVRNESGEYVYEYIKKEVKESYSKFYVFEYVRQNDTVILNTAIG